MDIHHVTGSDRPGGLDERERQNLVAALDDGLRVAIGVPSPSQRQQALATLGAQPVPSKPYLTATRLDALTARTADTPTPSAGHPDGTRDESFAKNIHTLRQELLELDG